MSQNNINIIKEVYDHFNNRDYSGVLERFDSGFEWVAADNSPLADKSPYRGTDAIRTGVFDRIAAGFERLVVVPDEIIAGEGERVVVLGYYEGKFRGKDEPFRTQVAHIWTLAEGKPVKFQQYVDTLKIALDSGSVVAKAASGS